MSPVYRTIVVLSLIALGGCVPFWREWTRDKGPNPATYSILPKHESWCYKTLGAIECYTVPQRLPPESLVSVDPPSRFPLTREEHARALRESQQTAAK